MRSRPPTGGRGPWAAGGPQRDRGPGRDPVRHGLRPRSRRHREDDLAALAALRSRRPKRGGGGPAAIAAGVALLLGRCRPAGRPAGRRGADRSAAWAARPTPIPTRRPAPWARRTLGGRLVRVRADGVVRRWAVRGAAGELTLQVLRRRARAHRAGRVLPDAVRVSDPGRRSFRVDLNVKRGDRIGVLLGPGARIGLRVRPGRQGAAVGGQRNAPSAPRPRPRRAPAARRRRAGSAGRRAASADRRARRRRRRRRVLGRAGWRCRTGPVA